MITKLLSVTATVALLIPMTGLATDAGSVPPTKHQKEALKQVPEAAGYIDPTAKGTVTKGMPVSPHQAQVIEELDKRFAYFDTDKDGRITPAEAKVDAKLESQWNKLDSNKDEMLNRQEFADFQPDAS